MATTPTTPTKPKTAEYVNAVRHLTQVLTNVWPLIMSDLAINSREISQEILRLDAELSEFQTRFQVTLKVIIGDSLMSPGSLHLHLPCRSSESRLSLEKFMQLTRVSITSLLGDDNTAPKCGICLTNTNRENQPRSTELPAEITNSISIPVRLPCGHVFCTECIYSWITKRRGKNPPICPLCRTRLECVENPLPKFFVEAIKVLCPEILDSERVTSGLQELVRTIMVTREEW